MITITYATTEEGACLTYEKGGGRFIIGTQHLGGTWRLPVVPPQVGKPVRSDLYQEFPVTDLTLVLTYLCQVHGFKSYKLEVKIPGLK